MVVVLGGAAVVGAASLWLCARSPLGRAIGLSLACFAEAARSEPGTLR